MMIDSSFEKIDDIDEGVNDPDQLDGVVLYELEPDYDDEDSEPITLLFCPI